MEVWVWIQYNGRGAITIWQQEDRRHTHLAEPTLYKHQDIRDPKAFPSLLPKTKTISFHILSKTLSVTRRKSCLSFQTPYFYIYSLFWWLQSEGAVIVHCLMSMLLLFDILKKSDFQMFSIGDMMVIEVWHNVVTMLSDVTSVIGMGSIQTWSILHKLYTPYRNQFVTNINQQIPEMSTPVRYVELSFDNHPLQLSEPSFFPTWELEMWMTPLNTYLPPLSPWPLIGPNSAEARSYWLTPGLSPCVPSVMFTPPQPRHPPAGGKHGKQSELNKMSHWIKGICIIL